MITKPKEAKSTKTLKGQLFGAVSMMLVAAIALGTSTYAWFINSQTVEVQQMDLTVSTATSLLAAVEKNGGGYTSFKTTITNADVTGAGDDQAKWDGMLTNELSPASITSENLAKATPQFFHSEDVVDNGKLTDFSEMTVGTTAANVGQGYVKQIPLKFVASSDLDVYFGQLTGTADSKVTMTNIADLIVAQTASGSLTEADMTAQRDAIRAALRIAVVARSTAGIADETISVFQFDKGNPAFGANSVNNTDYGSAAEIVLINETTGLYKAISAVTDKKVAKAGALQALVQGDTTNNAAERIAALAEVDSKLEITAPADGKPLFQLKENEERVVDVYIWLEGTDQDCVSSLSQAKFGINLPFVGTPTPTTPTTP